MARHLESLKITYPSSLNNIVMVSIENVKGQGPFLSGSTFQCQAPRSLENNLA